MHAQIGNAAVALFCEDFKALDFFAGRSDALASMHACIMELLDDEMQALVDARNDVEIED